MPMAAQELSSSSSGLPAASAMMTIAINGTTRTSVSSRYAATRRPQLE